MAIFDADRDLVPQDVSGQGSAAAVRDIVRARNLTPVYQPIVDLRDGSVLGFEGLIRPGASSPFTNPGQLFAAAAACGRTVELDLACFEVVAAGSTMISPEQVVTINLSPQTLEAQDFTASWLLEILTRYQISPGRVIVELTEREAITDLERLRRNVAALQHAGVRLAADDVGAGNAGLRLLSQVRFDIVKIDLSLVQEGTQHESSRAVVRSLMDLAARQGAVAIAEGLETAEQLRSLRELGITTGQGYLLGRPGSNISLASVDIETLASGTLIVQNLRRPRAADERPAEPDRSRRPRGHPGLVLPRTRTLAAWRRSRSSRASATSRGSCSAGWHWAASRWSWLLRQASDATSGFLGFSGILAAVIGLGWLLVEWGLPAPTELAIETGPALDEPRRAAIAAFAILALLSGIRLRRGGRAFWLGGAAVLAGIVAMALGAWGWSDAQPIGVSMLVQLLALAAVTGGSMAAVVLAHWYLVTPKISERPLLLTTQTADAGAGRSSCCCSASGWPPASPTREPFAVLAGPNLVFVWLRLVVGLVMPLLLTAMAYRTALTRSMESATGLLYIEFALVMASTIVADRAAVRRRAVGLAVRITVRLFAMQRAQTGLRNHDLELPDGADVAAAWRALLADLPVLAAAEGSVRFARNGAYVDVDERLADGDELAVIPPVAGGDATGDGAIAVPAHRGHRDRASMRASSQSCGKPWPARPTVPWSSSWGRRERPPAHPRPARKPRLRGMRSRPSRA